MPLPIIGAEERLAQTGMKIQIFGPAKIGKTTQLLTLDPARTLVLDFEAGLLSIGSHPVPSTPVRSWDDARNWACYITGPDPSVDPTSHQKPYGMLHYNHVCKMWGDPAQLDQFDTIFIDSTSFAGKLCMRWAQQQPEAFSDKTGKPDNRGAYGLLGQEMVAWAQHLHHSKKNVILVGGLEQREDDVGRKHWAPLIDGSKATVTLPYIFDVIITMADVAGPDGNPTRAFICQKINPWGFPAGDRSGRLELIEPPHLGNLMKKIRTQPPMAAQHFNYALPQQVAANAWAAPASHP